MKITETERIYAFEITNRQMGTLMRKDNASRERAALGYDNKALIHLLLDVPHVRSVEYDPMTGCVIFCRIETEGFDISSILRDTQRVISKYLN